MPHFPEDDTVRDLSQCVKKLNSLHETFPNPGLSTSYFSLLELEKKLKSVLESQLILPENFCTEFNQTILNLAQFIAARLNRTSSPDEVKKSEAGILEMAQKANTLFEPHLSTFHLKRMNKDLNDRLIKLEKEFEEKLEDSKHYTNELKKNIDEIFKSANNVGTQIAETQFSALQKKYKTASLAWLIISFVLLALFIFLVWVLSSEDAYKILIPAPLQNNENALWIYLSTKIILYTVSIYFLIFSAKNFSKFKHNEIICGHRSSSMHTLPIIHNFLNDPESKDTIIRIAASSIFGHINTGFINSQNDDSEGKIISHNLVGLTSDLLKTNRG